MKEKENLKESFCPICIASVPIAFSLAGDRVNMLNNDDQEFETINNRHRKQKQFFYRIIVAVAISVIIYYTIFAPCDSCKLPNK